MTFDSRAHQASQDIRRAVEVMEMSSTKTPQSVKRFDEYRDRKSRNQRIAALVVGIAIPVVLVIGAVSLLGSRDDQNVAAASPSASHSVTPGPVTRGSGGLTTPFTYTLPPDWTPSSHGAHYFQLDSPVPSGFIVLPNVVAAKPDCSGDPMPGVGSSSDAMIAWLSAHPALVATTPRPVKLGAATGSYVDVRGAAGWDQYCKEGLGLVTGSSGTGWELPKGAEERYYVLDLPSGDTVTIIVTASKASDFQDVIDEASPVVDSIRFK